MKKWVRTCKVEVRQILKSQKAQGGDLFYSLNGLKWSKSMRKGVGTGLVYVSRLLLRSYHAEGGRQGISAFLGQMFISSSYINRIEREIICAQADKYVYLVDTYV